MDGDGYVVVGILIDHRISIGSLYVVDAFRA